MLYQNIEKIKVDSWVSTVLHADSPPCAKSPTLKQVVLGRILTVLAQVWRVGSSYDPPSDGILISFGKGTNLSSYEALNIGLKHHILAIPHIGHIHLTLPTNHMGMGGQIVGHS